MVPDNPFRVLGEPLALRYTRQAHQEAAAGSCRGSRDRARRHPGNRRRKRRTVPLLGRLV